MKKQIFLFISCALFSLSLAAQSDIVTTGGDIQGASGSISYSVGQMAVQSTATITEGVQQPYEIVAVGVDNYPHITLNAMVYPNPTTDKVTLSVGSNNHSPLRATLFNANGQHIQTVNVTSVQTDIDMTGVAAGTYYLRVTDGQTTLKTFKVVKMM